MEYAPGPAWGAPRLSALSFFAARRGSPSPETEAGLPKQAASVRNRHDDRCHRMCYQFIHCS